MNIFVLGNTPVESASYAVDAHLNKQVLECFQMLAVAFPDKLPKKSGGFYGTTHENHPLTKWVCASERNAKFTLCYAAAFANEHAKRLGSDISGSYPFEEAALLLTGISHQPDTYPLYVPEYIRQRLIPGDHELGETPRIVDSLDVAVKGYRLCYVLEKSRNMQKFVWSGKMPDWYAEMCAKIGRVPF